MTLWLFLVTGCGPTEPCDQYRDNAVVWPACISRWAGSAETVAEAERRCSQAPETDVACREASADGAWAKPVPPTREALLSFCRSDDCAFRAIDSNPPDNILTTIELCETRVGRLGPDCATHAYARWAVGELTPEEIARVRAAPSIFADRLDAAFGHRFYCTEPRQECPADYGPACAAAYEEAAGDAGFCAEWRQRSVATQFITQPTSLTSPTMPALAGTPAGRATSGTAASPTGGAVGPPNGGASGPANAGNMGPPTGGGSGTPPSGGSPMAPGSQPLPPLPGTPPGPAVVAPGG